MLGVKVSRLETIGSYPSLPIRTNRQEGGGGHPRIARERVAVAKANIYPQEFLGGFDTTFSLRATAYGRAFRCPLAPSS